MLSHVPLNIVTLLFIWSTCYASYLIANLLIFIFTPTHLVVLCLYGIALFLCHISLPSHVPLSIVTLLFIWSTCHTSYLTATLLVFIFTPAHLSGVMFVWNCVRYRNL